LPKYIILQPSLLKQVLLKKTTVQAFLLRISFYSLSNLHEKDGTNPLLKLEISDGEVPPKLWF